MMGFSAEHSAPTIERVLVTGIIDLLRAPGMLVADKIAYELIDIIEPYHEPGYVDDIELAIGFLEPGPEQALDLAADHLEEHRRTLLTVEEEFEIESRERDVYNDFCRALGEEPDPDAPFEFPEIEGGDR